MAFLQGTGVLGLGPHAFMGLPTCGFFFHSSSIHSRNTYREHTLGQPRGWKRRKAKQSSGPQG